MNRRPVDLTVALIVTLLCAMIVLAQLTRAVASPTGLRPPVGSQVTPRPPGADGSPGGREHRPPCHRNTTSRTCDFGPWNGVVMCESSGQLGALGAAGEMSLFQFTRRTWDWTVVHAGRPWLAGVDVRGVAPRTQWKMAQHLAVSVPGGGLGHWSCSGRYGDGTGPVVVR